MFEAHIPGERAREAAATRGRLFRAGHRVELAGSGVATELAAGLLTGLGLAVAVHPGLQDAEPEAEWARSGAMWLTGSADGPPLLAPGPLASCARGALLALAALLPDARRADLETLDAPALLGERAALFGLERRGPSSPSGTCRLLPASGGWIAVNLARDDDRRALPAWLEDDSLGGEGEAGWQALARALARWDPEAALERARWIGLPVAPAPLPGDRPPWLRIAGLGPPSRRTRVAAPRILDLSTLWAGPLATHLLQRAGAEVVKLESTRRPDGARSGAPAFFDLMHGGKRCVALDLGRSEGMATLRRLLEWADVVVESARPRGLRQLGVVAEDEVARRSGLTWVSITGYGRGDPQGHWVAFGDDAAAAAGAAMALRDGAGVPRFCGDAIADPLTGMHAALAAWASHAAGGGHLLDVNLRDVSAACLAAGGRERPAGMVRATTRGHEWVGDTAPVPVARPRARRAAKPARGLGADTRSVLAELLTPC